MVWKDMIWSKEENNIAKKILGRFKDTLRKLNGKPPVLFRTELVA